MTQKTQPARAMQGVLWMLAALLWMLAVLRGVSSVRRPGITCALLYDVCLAMNPRSECSGNYSLRLGSKRFCESQRPFGMAAYGPRGVASVLALRKQRDLTNFVYDSVQSTCSRHIDWKIALLENESMPSSLPLDLAAPSDPSRLLTLLWPKWELSHGDLMLTTVIPMAIALARGQLPYRFGVSDWTHAQSMLEPLRALGRSFCATERDGPGLPRYASSCYEQLQICAFRPYASDVASIGYAPMHALDKAAFALPDVSSERATLAPPGALLRVVFAQRVGRRYVQNTAELLAACDGQVVLGRTLSCAQVSFGTLGPRGVVETMRAADVTVSMHGGDEVNAIHMRPGRAVVEIVNCGFHLAPAGWLEQYRVVLQGGLRHFRLTARQPAGERQALTLPEGWNANGTVPWAALRRVLTSGVGDFDARDAARRKRGTWPGINCDLAGACVDAAQIALPHTAARPMGTAVRARVPREAARARLRARAAHAHRSWEGGKGTAAAGRRHRGPCSSVSRSRTGQTGDPKSGRAWSRMTVWRTLRVCEFRTRICSFVRNLHSTTRGIIKLSEPYCS
jgi:hypothetical protein